MDSKTKETAFMKMTKGRNENYFQFCTQYERAYRELREVGMQEWSFRDQCIHFIDSLREEHLEPVYQEFEAKGSYGLWTVCSLRDLCDLLDSFSRKQKLRAKQFESARTGEERLDSCQTRNHRNPRTRSRRRVH